MSWSRRCRSPRGYETEISSAVPASGRFQPIANSPTWPISYDKPKSAQALMPAFL